MWFSILTGYRAQLTNGFQNLLRAKGRRESGATTAEYALLLALVVIILISTLSQLGAELNAKLLEIIEQLREAG